MKEISRIIAKSILLGFICPHMGCVSNNYAREYQVDCCGEALLLCKD